MEGSGEKRRRLEKDGEEQSKKKKKKKTVSKELERAEENAATEEEVEEFFAILKRMQAAVKYFGEGWRTAIESEVMAPDAAAEIVERDDINGGDGEGDDKDEMVMRTNGGRVVVVEEDQNGVLDLNCVPEGESHGSAG